MNQWKIGDVKISRVVESEARWDRTNAATERDRRKYSQGVTGPIFWTRWSESVSYGIWH